MMPHDHDHGERKPPKDLAKHTQPELEALISRNHLIGVARDVT